MSGRVDYSEWSARLTDEEVLTNAEQDSLLVEKAKIAIHSELARRGLQGTSLKRYQEEMEKQIDAAVLGQAPVQRGKWIEITVPNGPLRFPPMCPTCLKLNPDSDVLIRSEQEDVSSRIVYSKHRYLTITIPHCGACAHRFLFWQKISQISIVVGILLGVFIMIKFNLDRWAAWALVVPLCTPGILASMYLKRSVRLVHFDLKWLGFSFRSIEYATKFKALNSN
jgi:hypothetical protein